VGTANELAVVFRRDLGRLIGQLDAFPADETLWKTLPGVSNSAGTLFLHLEGNLREYIGRQLGGVNYKRQRDLEFSARNVPAAELAARLRPLPDLIAGVVSDLSEDALSRTYPENVLGSPVSTERFLIHLHGHLNYHLGQIDYLRRAVTGSGAIQFKEP
jgi:hypothetical protein